MKKMAGRKAKTVRSKALMQPVEAAFDEFVELIRATHKELELTRLAGAERLLGKQSQDHREIAGAPGSSGSKAA